MKAELLAPAGSWEGMEAAFLAGADAVYIGGKNFGARAYANNLDDEKMADAIDYAHLHQKKLYLTVNTLVKDGEMEQSLYEYLAPLWERGLDAVIVQDLGVLSFIRENFPGLSIHASTQMAVTGPEGAQMLKQLGADRIVTARELSLEEIRRIYETSHIEIESFIHGALCYSYSGMCLFSSILGGRSGNRGRCAQPCRLPYDVYEQGRRLNSSEARYLLSPKDMCTIELLPRILEAGVYSLKIEGRMKKPEYAAGVTRIYRKYLDKCLTSADGYKVAREDYEELAALYQRDGFNKGYYQIHNGKEMMAVRNQKLTDKKGHLAEEKSRELYEKLKREYLGISQQEPVKGTLRMRTGEPSVLTLECRNHRVCVQGEAAQAAVRQPLSEARVREQMRKTGNTPFYFEELAITIEGDVFLPMQNLNEMRRSGLDKLKEELLAPYRRKETEISVKERKPEKNVCQTPVLYVSVETEEQFREVLSFPEVQGIYWDMSMAAVHGLADTADKMLQRTKQAGKECYLSLPYIVRGDVLEKESAVLQSLADKGMDGFLVRNLESYALLKKLGLEKQAVLDYVLYSFNNRAEAFWETEGVKRQTIPLELNEKELRQRENGNSEMIIYGRYPMMISAQCLKKTTGSCDHKNSQTELKDRYGQEFPVKCYCSFCYNVIYNSIPTGLLKESQAVKKLGVPSVRLAFSTEDGKTAREMTVLFAGVYLHTHTLTYGTYARPQGMHHGMPYGYNQKNPPYVPEFTKGHFKRGVE
jgi:putative protease